MPYSAAMNEKPPVPDELFMFNGQFSLRMAWKVCRWWLAAFVISAVFDLIFPEVKKQLPLGWRTTIVFAEFFAIVLFCFDVARWIRSMDELQRRIALELFLFSVSASFFVFVLWLRLEREGVFNAVFGPPILGNNTWGISSVAHACVLLGGFWGVGYLIFKRRYK
jgi:hypothetical protein